MHDPAEYSGFVGKKVEPTEAGGTSFELNIRTTNRFIGSMDSTLDQLQTGRYEDSVVNVMNDEHATWRQIRVIPDTRIITNSEREREELKGIITQYEGDAPLCNRMAGPHIEPGGRTTNP